MKECWINVYDRNIYPGWRKNIGKECDNREQAARVSYNISIVAYVRTLYRIHVRLK